MVLLSGGGPFDRDAAYGVNKPLKDLAWGLASRGIAVLRFDKVTFTHAAVTADPGFTMTDEYVPHAVAAVRLLQPLRRTGSTCAATTRSGQRRRSTSRCSSFKAAATTR